NLAQAFDSLFPNLGNSIIVAIGATIGSALLGSVNGFVLAKWKFRGADVLLLILLFGMFIPYQVILIPMVKALDTIGLYGNLGGLILVHILYGLPLTTLIFRNFYSSIPNELLEAAALDGAGGVRTFRDVILPLSGPGFVVVAIFQFTNIWNDFLFGLVVVPNPKYQPITVALNNLSGALAVDWGVVMAGAVLASLPTGIVYLLLGRFFVSGLMAGSIK
ncbi:MAG: carbohydrate ABC transporter permease, partial [Candidatus Microbacterium stercoravium]